MKEKVGQKNTTCGQAETYFYCGLFFIRMYNNTVSRIDDSHMTVTATGVLSLFICPLRPGYYSLPTYTTCNWLLL